MASNKLEKLIELLYGCNPSMREYILISIERYFPIELESVNFVDVLYHGDWECFCEE